MVVVWSYSMLLSMQVNISRNWCHDSNIEQLASRGVRRTALLLLLYEGVLFRVRPARHEGLLCNLELQ